MNRVIKIGPPPPGVAPSPIASPLAFLGERSAYVLAGTGGKLERSDHAGVILPPGALADDGDVSLSTPVARFQAEEDLKSRKLGDDGLVAVSTGVVFEPLGAALKTQAEFSVPYDSATMVSLGIPDLQLKLYWWNQDKQDWFWCPARVDPATRTLRGRAMKFGHYRVLWRKDGN